MVDFRGIAAHGELFSYVAAPYRRQLEGESKPNLEAEVSRDGAKFRRF
jgi:hypothetical protein